MFVVLASEAVGGRSQVTELPCFYNIFLAFLFYFGINYVLESINYCMHFI